MGITGIDHVQVAAPPGREDDARAFYGGLLGLDEIPKPERLRVRGGVWFRAGAQELHVGVEDPFTPARKAHPGFVVDDITAFRAVLEGAGHDVTEDDALPGAQRIYVHDPFGNRLEVREA